jgi:hypothetical protein
MSVIQVGLIDKTGSIDPKLVEATAASLNVQVMRDLSQCWPVQATVRYLPDPTSIPVGVWPVFLVQQLPPGEGGVHLDDNNQPYSLVVAAPDSDDWTVDASHESVEMLVDPGGNRLEASRAIEISGDGVHDVPGEFEYLVEACDPCQASQYAYAINGIMVSDFITPRFYDPVATTSTRYSFGGNIQQPRQLLPGGYISFINPQLREVQQILWLGGAPELKTLGPSDGASLRAFVDGKTMAAVHKARKPNAALAAACKAHRAHSAKSAAMRAKTYGL